MSFLGKVYTFEKQENYLSFVNALMLPSEISRTWLNTNSVKLDKDGDTYAYIVQDNDGSAETVVSFKSGETQERTISDTLKIKVTFTVIDNIFTEVQKNENKITTIKREFSTNAMKETYTTNFRNGPAWRYFKAA